MANLLDKLSLWMGLGQKRQNEAGAPPSTVTDSVVKQPEREAAPPPSSPAPHSLNIVGGGAHSLPDPLEVEGDLILMGGQLAALPSVVRVGGNLLISGRSRIRELPRSLHVGGHALLDRLAIERLPDELYIGRHLRVIHAKRLKSIQSALTVAGMLDLRGCTALEEVTAPLAPLDLLILRGCTSLLRLPSDLCVRVGLDLSGCASLAKLPSGLDIGKQSTSKFHRRRGRRLAALDLSDCAALTELPADLQLGGPIEVAGAGLRGLPPQLAHVPLFWRGIQVTPQVAFHPETLTLDEIFNAVNAELRRVMLERAGPARVLAMANCKVLDEDRDAGGPRRLLELGMRRLRFLECRCPSTGRLYLLRVSPSVSKCHAAAAQLAGFSDPAMYRPIVET